MKRLGEIMENIRCNDDCEIIEPVIPITLAAKLIDKLGPSLDTFNNVVIDFGVDQVKEFGGFLIVLDNSDKCIAIHVIAKGGNNYTTIGSSQQELLNMYSPQLTDTFIDKLKEISPTSMEGHACKYIDGQQYYLYGFTE